MKKFTSPLLLFIAAAIWGLAFTAQKASDAIPPFALGAARSAIAAIFILITIPITDKILHTGRHILTDDGAPDITATEGVSIFALS